MGKNKIILVLIVIVCVFFNASISIKAETENGINVSAESVIVIDLERGQVLYEKYADKQFQPAMLSKLMTSLLAVEKYSLTSTQVTASSNAAGLMGYDDIVLEAGGMYRIDDIISASVMTLSDNTCTAAFEAVDTDVLKFVDLMNDKAQLLSMSNTLFSSPIGVYDDLSYTTARDMSAFMQYAFGVQGFKEVFASKVRFVDKSLKESGYISNSNEVLWSYSDAQGGSFMDFGDDTVSAISYASRGDMNLIAIALNTPSNKYASDSIMLFEHCFRTFERILIAQKGQKLNEIAVGKEMLDLVVSSDVYYLAAENRNYIVNQELVLDEEVTAPIEEGEYIGSVRYTLEDGTKILVSLQAGRSIYSGNETLNDIIEKLSGNPDIIKLVIFLSVLEGVLILFYLGKFLKGRFEKKRE